MLSTTITNHSGSKSLDLKCHTKLILKMHKFSPPISTIMWNYNMDPLLLVLASLSIILFLPQHVLCVVLRMKLKHIWSGMSLCPSTLVPVSIPDCYEEDTILLGFFVSDSDADNMVDCFLLCGKSGMHVANLFFRMSHQTLFFVFTGFVAPFVDSSPHNWRLLRDWNPVIVGFPPLDGLIKMNCDAGQISNRSSYGIIIHHAKGDVLTSRYGNLLLQSTFVAESYVMLLGLQLISSRGWSNVLIEFVCGQLILLLLDPGGVTPWQCSKIIFDCHSISSSLCWTFRAIRRKANSAIHHLARFAMLNDICNMDIISTSPFMYKPYLGVNGMVGYMSNSCSPLFSNKNKAAMIPCWDLATLRKVTNIL